MDYNNDVFGDMSPPRTPRRSPRSPPRRRSRRYAVDEGDDTPIPLNMPSPRPLRSCFAVSGRVDRECLAEECPLTMAPITEENGVSFRCPTRGTGTATMCFNMFALLVALYTDVIRYNRPPQLPTNRAQVSSADFNALIRRVARRLDEGYAEDPDHEDYEYAESLRQLFAASARQ